MSLFGDIIDGLKAWVRDRIEDAISDLRAWTRNVVKAAIDAVDWVIKNFNTYVTKTYKYFTDYITNTYNYLTEYVTNVYNNITENIYQTINNLTQNITNVSKNFITYVSNTYGIDEAWVRNFFKLMDPTGFLRDPLGTIKAVFALWGAAADHAVAKSFWEGFEEGLEEEEVIT